MSKNKMRSKDEIRGVLSTAIKKGGNEVATELIMVEILEAFLDIRNILDERMVKSIEISGEIEEMKDSEVTMLGRPVVNVRTGKRVKREDLEDKVWYMDLKNNKKRRKK